MKTLIVYASKTGTTRKCASLLAEALPGAEVFDLAKEIPDPGAYDAVIVGGSIRAGSLSGETKRYLEQCAPILAGKRLGLFLCCCDDTQAEKYFSANVPESLLKSAVVHRNFGGELNRDRAKGLDRLILKLLQKAADKNGMQPALYPDRVRAFAAAMTGENA